MDVTETKDLDQNKALDDIHQHLSIQDAKLNYIISLLEKILEKP